jgi:hypothetical protein
MFYLGGHHSKSPAGITSSRRLYGCIERKNSDLTRYSFIHKYMIVDPFFYVTYNGVDAAHTGAFILARSFRF